MFWCSHLSKSFPQFVMIHTVKGFSVVNEANILLKLPCCSPWGQEELDTTGQLNN